jgi:O-antigen/teichoic acid export membrane protein
MHAAEIAQPLLILPYAGHVLGAHQFGQYAYALTIGQFAATFVEYGFYWTAQRAAASARHEPAALALLLAEVVATKTVLCLLVTLVGLVAAGGFLAISRSMFLCAMLNALGSVFFASWLLIGLERAWQAAVATIVARCVALLCFLMLVVSPAQVELAVGIQSAIPVVCAIVSLPFVAHIGIHGLRRVTLSGILRQLTSGSQGFLYSFVERASIALPVLLLGHFGDYVAVAQYSIAEKFVSATRPFFRVMSDTFLPRVAFYARHDPEAGVRLIWISLSTGVVGATLSLGLFFLAPYGITMLFGNSFAGAVPIVRLMSVVPLLINLNTCTSNLYMFNYGHDRAWSSLVAGSLLVFITVAYLLLLSLPNAATAVAIAVVAKEAVVLFVSAGFFFIFGLTHRGPPPGIAATRGAPALLRAVRPGPVGSASNLK